MSSINLECPHCGAEKVGFNIAYESPISIRPPKVQMRYRVLLVCASCEEAIVGTLDRFGPGVSPIGCNLDPTKMGWTLADSYPRPKPSKCPDYTPEYLKKIFLQAADSLKRRAPDASGAMSRKVVDVSTQELLGEESKKYNNIQGRIDALAAAGKLTPDLQDWAHQVRLGGNDAAHDLNPFTQEEADELLDFAELYLTYVYTLPGRLKERRERAEREKTEAIKSE